MRFGVLGKAELTSCRGFVVQPTPGPAILAGRSPFNHHPWERIRKSLIFKHLLFIVAGSGAHYREIETGVNDYFKNNSNNRRKRFHPTETASPAGFFCASR